jgi:lipopolysaccharide exporter
MGTEKLHYWLKSGAYNLAQNVQSLIFGFGGFYLLIRLTDKESYGIWALFLATTTIFETARSGLIQNALIKFLSAAPKEEHQEIISASVFLNAVLMIIALIVNFAMAGFLARLWHYPALVPMFYAYSFVYIGQGALSQLQWIEQANLSFAGVFLSGVIRQGGPFVYILSCAIFHFNLSLLTLVYATFISTFLATALQYFFVRNYLTPLSKPDMQRVKDLFNYGKYVFSTSISVVLIGTINQVMLGTIMTPAAAGSYNVIARITNLTDMPINALSTLLFPQSSKRFASQGAESGKYLYEKSVGVSLALTIPALLVVGLFPQFVLRIIAGSKYLDIAPLLYIVAVGSLFTPFNRLFGTILDSTGKPQVNFIIVVLFALTESVLTYYLIIAFGLGGAIYATNISGALFFAIMQIILHRYFKVNFLNAFRYAAKFYPEMVDNYVKPMLTK